MFPIEAGKIEKRDRIIPSLSGKLLSIIWLNQPSVVLFWPLEPFKSATFVWLLLMRWTEYFAFFREEDCLNLLLFLELTELCKRAWQSHKNQTAGIRINLKRRNRADIYCQFFILKWSLHDRPSAAALVLVHVEVYSLTSVLSSADSSLSAFGFSYMCRCTIFCSASTFRKNTTQFSTLTVKKTPKPVTLKIKRSELHATAACLTSSDHVWPFQSSIYHLHSEECRHSVTAKTLRVIKKEPKLWSLVYTSLGR